MFTGAAVAASCGGTTPVASPAADLHRAAVATADAHSFTVRYLTGVDVTYQAPDRVQQVEHGEASSSSSSSNGPTSTSGTFAETITKVFIADREYESSGPLGQPEPFSVSARCPGDSNVAEYVLGILRAIAVSARVTPEPGGGFAFSIPKGGAVLFPIDGVATIASGYVATIDVNPGTGNPPVITIGSVDSAPPVTTPTSSRAAQMSCSSSPTTTGTSASTAP